MRTHWLRLFRMLLAAGMVAMAVTASTGAASKPAATIPLTITFAGGAPVPTSYLTACDVINGQDPSFRVRSDGAGDVSAPYFNGVAGVSATLDDTNAWVNFETNPNPAPRPGPRRVLLGFCGGIVDSTSPDAFADVVTADVYALLFKTSPSQSDVPSLGGMSLGQHTTRRFYIEWPRSKPAYKLSWLTDASGIGGVDVECTAVTTLSNNVTKCSQWTVTPNGPAVLEKFSRTATRTVGYVAMPFEMTARVQ